jgi:hypothetical protein
MMRHSAMVPCWQWSTIRRNSARSALRSASEALGGSPIAFLLHQDVQHDPVLIPSDTLARFVAGFKAARTRRDPPYR